MFDLVAAATKRPNHTSFEGNQSFIRKLERFVPLTAAEKRVLENADVGQREVTARQDIVSEGSSPTEIIVLVEGFACRYTLLPDGRRQITAFLIPGDFCNLRALHTDRMDFGVAAFNCCHVARIPRQKLSEIIESYSQIALALWRDTVIDAAIYRQWLTNVGRRPAYARIAHLLCEVFWRFQAVGLLRQHSCELPVTQTDLADATGLSTVHVNRTLQQMRAEGLIVLQSRLLSVLDWPRLREVGEFDPSYLGVSPELNHTRVLSDLASGPLSARSRHRDSTIDCDQ
jgi:CRP-like cAMP-binding protein